jgi:N-acetylglutamate synthase-like GNAT family acetyltransferase
VTSLEGLGLRRALEADQALIRQMVIQEAGLDPTSLGWSHFVIAEVNGEVAGLGQIRPYPRCPELGSIFTRPAYRGQGVAAAIIRRLVDDWQPHGPIYLECQGHMTSYYQRFGFDEISGQPAPMPLKLKAGVGAFFARVFGFKLAVMKFNTPKN